MTSSTRYSLRRAPRARANSLPSSKSQLQADTPSDIQSRPATPRGSRYGTLAGRITPDTSRKFSDVVRVPSAPSRADEETPDSERCSSVYPVASNASETRELRVSEWGRASADRVITRDRPACVARTTSSETMQLGCHQWDERWD
ncbi:hypothetical protein SCLCIDRAFT_1213489 [Scleroderma citrinum Foug A]|uniref:Uncharacterized protein n=1 Tax=Scleroderma citrinum Foug A TaxID=1036808 RepID=A0A0C3E7G3_9AGAM|nr:hypothetical protein SCLCIDRAFT_1213489 [Scleroderma citrinum Foug A]